VTHIACPLCGRWSSLKKFPAGSQDNLPLADFVGLGRAKGFKVVRCGSGLDDRDLSAAVKGKLLNVLAVFVKHGYIAPGEIEAVTGLAHAPGRPPASNGPSWREKTQVLEAALRKERTAKEYLEQEVNRLEQAARAGQSRRDDLEAELSALRSRLRDVEEQVAEERRSKEYLEEEVANMRNADAERSRLAGKVRRVLESLRGVVSELETAAMDDPALGKLARRLDQAVEGLSGATDGAEE
jgi:hypothetical protein